MSELWLSTQKRGRDEPLPSVTWLPASAEQEGLAGPGAPTQQAGGVTLTASWPSSLVFLRLRKQGGITGLNDKIYIFLHAGVVKQYTFFTSPFVSTSSKSPLLFLSYRNTRKMSLCLALPAAFPHHPLPWPSKPSQTFAWTTAPCGL